MKNYKALKINLLYLWYWFWRYYLNKHNIMDMKIKKNTNQNLLNLFTGKMKVITTLALMWIAMLIMASSLLAQTTATNATPQQMVDALHAAFGKHPNARAVHAKGIILKGTFFPEPEAAKVSKALHFSGSASDVTFRFSDFTGIPDIPDTLGAANPRGLAIKFHLSDGSSTDIVSHSFDGFPVATTDEFREFLLAISKSGPEVAHPSPLEQFLSNHPIAKSFVSNQKKPSISYSTLNYYGVNTFRFTNDAGVTKLIRYQFIPVQGEQFLTSDQMKSADGDYLSKEIVKRLKKGPVKYRMYAQLSEDGDKTLDPSVAWPKSRKKILLGILTINRLSENTLREDKGLLFNPGNLPPGIDIADQMLLDRMKSYPVSVAERNP